MDEFTRKLLDFIVKYTWHVLDECSAPAKLPYQIFLKYDKSKSKVDKALEYLREEKLITGYSFSNQKIGLRATAKGNVISKVGFSRRDVKRWLIIDGDKLTLMGHEDYVNSRDDFSFMGENDGEKSVDLEVGIRVPNSSISDEKSTSTDSIPSFNLKKKKNMEDWL